MDNEARHQQIKERLDFESWAGQQTAEANIFFLHFFLIGHELSEWHLARSRPPDRDGAITSQAWFWIPSDEGGDGTQLRIDTIECPSLEDAHERLVPLLADFQGPPLERRENGPGDLAFAPIELETALVMARGNLLFRFLNAGVEVTEVKAVAAKLDDALVETPEPKRADIPGPQIRQVAIEPDPPLSGESAELILDARDPSQEEGVSFRIYSKGTLRREDEQLYYQLPAEGTDRIRIYAFNRAGGVSQETLEVGRE